ncbi:hypothetical protein QE411_002977 [Microbacterium arborescens]|nr:hypothetical protein [Microbacterium arborescens]MDQ1218122.1 hypothetical protein [Microbacterium arborescens]
MVTATSREIPVAGNPEIHPTRQASRKGSGLNRHSAPNEGASGEGCDQFEESAVRTLEIDNARAGAGTVSHPVWRPGWSPAVYGTQLEHPIEIRDRQRDVHRADARRGARSLRRLGRGVLQQLDSLVTERDCSCADRRPADAGSRGRRVCVEREDTFEGETEPGTPQ